MPSKKDTGTERSDREAAEIRDAALKRALAMPPQHQPAKKAVKPKAKPRSRKATS